MFHSENTENFDKETGRLMWLNEFSEYHVNLLKEELNKLQQHYLDATVIHADYHGSSIDIFKSADQFGEFLEVHRTVCRWCYNKFQTKILCTKIITKLDKCSFNKSASSQPNYVLVYQNRFLN
jgi:hypothetical protein